MAQQSEKSWPLFRSLASWRATDLPGDLIAGLTLAAIAIPEQMATARLGGFEPQIGFFAFIAGSVGFAMLGGNRFLSCGADSTITPIRSSVDPDGEGRPSTPGNCDTMMCTEMPSRKPTVTGTDNKLAMPPSLNRPPATSIRPTISASAIASA